MNGPVRPPLRSDAATPDVAVARAIYPLLCTVASKARYKKNFPVSPGPSMKNALAFFENVV